MKRVATNSSICKPEFDRCHELTPFNATEIAMQSKNEGNRGSAFDDGHGIRNPFKVMDVPNPDDREVQEFAVGAKLDGAADDENAKSWGTAGDLNQHESIAGTWSSRWNGGV